MNVTTCETNTRRKKALESECDIYSHVTFPQINMELLICPSGRTLETKFNKLKALFFHRKVVKN